MTTITPPTRPHSLRRRPDRRDRKSTRLNSSHLVISYAVFCLKKKKNIEPDMCLACLDDRTTFLLLRISRRPWAIRHISSGEDIARAALSQLSHQLRARVLMMA